MACPYGPAVGGRRYSRMLYRRHLGGSRAGWKPALVLGAFLPLTSQEPTALKMATC